MRKLTAILLLVAMMCSISTTGFAADADGGITPEENYAGVYAKYFGTTSVTGPDSINRVFAYVSVPAGVNPAEIGLDTITYSSPDYYCVGVFNTVQQLPWASAAKKVTITDQHEMYLLIGNQNFSKAPVTVNGSHEIPNQSFDLRRVSWTKLQWANGAQVSTTDTVFDKSDAVWHVDGETNLFKLKVTDGDTVLADKYIKMDTDFSTEPDIAAIMANPHFSVWMDENQNVLSSTVMPAKDIAIRSTYSEHSFTQYQSDNNATCLVDGTETAVCDQAGCNVTNTRTQQNSAKGHSFTKYTPNTGTAGCLVDGTETAICDWEGCNATDTRTANGSALGHQFGAYVSNGDATCTQDGTEHAECGLCETVVTRVSTGSALGHSFINYVSDNNETCETDGTKTATCNHDCGQTNTVTEFGSALGHSFGNYIPNNDATCEEDGTMTATCTRQGCNATETVIHSGSATGHNWDNGVVTKEPTTSATGEKTFTCGNCEATKVETLDKLPVIEPENGNNTGSGSSSGGYDYWDGGDTVSTTPTTSTATAPETISLVMQVNSRDMEYNKEGFVYDVAPVLQENRTLVPIRVIVEKLGGKVDWHEDGRTVTLTLDGKVMTMTIGERIPGFDATPIILHDRTFVPVRYVMEQVGAKVDWDASTGTVVITK